MGSGLPWLVASAIAGGAVATGIGIGHALRFLVPYWAARRVTGWRTDPARGLYGVRWPRPLAYRRGMGWLRRGWCPCCYSSPPRPECPVCRGHAYRPYAGDGDRGLLDLWNDRWKELHHRA